MLHSSIGATLISESSRENSDAYDDAAAHPHHFFVRCIFAEEMFVKVIGERRSRDQKLRVRGAHNRCENCRHQNRSNHRMEKTLHQNHENLFGVIDNDSVRIGVITSDKSDEGYSDKELWAAGFVLQEMNLFGAKSAAGKKLRAQAKLLHPENEGTFVEYWARLYFARTLSLVLIVAAVVCCFTGMMDESMVLMIHQLLLTEY